MSFEGIIAKSDKMTEIFSVIERVAEFKTSVLIQGESGTGKELIARALHNKSSRKNKQFVAINCGAIPENLIESELFGHSRGAFTDATRDKTGLFAEADGGTLLLDEIGELPVHLQVKLLRVLQEGKIRPVGSEKNISVDVRIIAATLRDLEEDSISGRFRSDLFYRLNVVNIAVPSLRERKMDIPLLVTAFTEKTAERLSIEFGGISDQTMSVLIAYHWPGNIRELENAIERAMILAEGAELKPEHLPTVIHQDPQTTELTPISSDELSIKIHTRRLEEILIRKALKKTKGNRTHAAKMLEVSHRTLLYKLKEYNLSEVE